MKEMDVRMMEDKNKHEFAADRPIEKLSDDLLGRSKFSIALAKALSGWHGKDSLVVALHGDWGSGKSSIKNMAMHELSKDNNNAVDIIEFSPWEWAAQDKITSAFFQEISTTIGLRDNSKEGKKLAKLFKKYGRYLNTGEMLTSGLSKALPTMFILATIFGVGGNFSDEEWIKNLSVGILALLGAWGVFLKWGNSFLKQLAGNAEASAKDSELTLSQYRSELTSLLSNRNKTLMIVLDDLDRLTTKQLQMVMQLVKANTEFPNVVFLMLFQRDLIEDKLNDGLQSGRDYLEKIIQVPFDIPKIEGSKVHQVLFKKLDEIISSDLHAEKMFDSTYWGNVFQKGLSHYFSNLRSVYRFVSTLSFHFSIYKNENAFEVNPVDLIAIECIRVFEPDVYKSISESKVFFTKTRTPDGRDAEERKYFDEILALSVNSKKMADLLKILFPTIKRLDRQTYAQGYYDTWQRNMRVCHESSFDKYFSFNIPEGGLSNSDLTKMVELTGDREAFCKLIISLQESSILRTALGQFSAYIELIPLDNRTNYISALLDIGDTVENESSGFSFNNSYIQIFQHLSWFLRRIEPVSERSELLFTCFDSSCGGLAIIEYVLQADTERQNGDNLLCEDGFNKIKELFINKLNSLAQEKPEGLVSHPHLGSLIWRWKKWGNEDMVKTWMELQAQNNHNLFYILEAFITRGSSMTMGDAIAKPTAKFNKESFEEFLSVKILEDALSLLDRESLSVSQLDLINIFNKSKDRE
jgi:Cdc6-like AAA superfamily ATPase